MQVTHRFANPFASRKGGFVVSYYHGAQLSMGCALGGKTLKKNRLWSKSAVARQPVSTGCEQTGQIETAHSTAYRTFLAEHLNIRIVMSGGALLRRRGES
jgi:hypothetical protein